MKKILFLGLILLMIIPMFDVYAQWAHIFNTNRGINTFAVNNTNLLAGGEDSIFIDSDNGKNWIGWKSPYINKLSVSGNNIYAGTWGGGVYFSINNGAKWDTIGLRNNNFERNVSSILHNNIGLFAGTSGGLFLTTDSGVNWSTINLGIGSNPIESVMSLAMSGANLYVGTYWENGTKNGGVFHSSDNGITWSPYNNNLAGKTVSELAVLGTDVIAGTTYNGIFISTDNGMNWVPINNGLKSISINALYSYDNKLLAATFNGNDVYLSTNKGSNWTKFSNGFTSDIYIYDFIVYGNDVFAGTSNGIWKRPVSEMVLSVSQSQIVFPEEYSLSQNYPNPFNPTTNISFSLPAKSFVSLKIFDSLGKVVAILENGYLSAGCYTKQWNAMNVSSGIYFYSLITGSHKETKKLVLLR